MGMYLKGEIANFGAYKGDITKEARKSPLAEDIPKHFPLWHAAFETLYDLVRESRNDALHEGAFARHLTSHAVDLTIVLEDALMRDSFEVRDFMVSDPVCATRFQPISSIRRIMLANSFTYLPLAGKDGALSEWNLVSDFAVASFLRSAVSGAQKQKRLACLLGEAIETNQIVLQVARQCRPSDSITDVLARSDGKPVLVLDENGNLHGIVTPFDLL